MSDLCNRGPLHICPVISFYLSIYLSFFFPRLISAAAGWMSTILWHMVWCGPSANLECRSERRCTRLAANAGPKKVAKNRHLCTIPQLCRAISSQLRHVSTIGKTHNKLRPTSGWDRFVSLGHPRKFQRVLRLGSVTARHSSSGRQPNCGVQQRAPPIFGRAAITLGIGPHSSCC